MVKRIAVPGLLGALTYLLCMAIFNVFFGFTNRLAMQRVPNEHIVYETLRQQLPEPGIYLCDAAPDSGMSMPTGEPVYGILYSGIGHDAAGIGGALDLVIILVAPIIVAWLLSMTSTETLSRFGRRVLFVAVIGLLLAIFGDLKRFAIGGYPMMHALLFSARTLVTWILVGLVIAWRTSPPSTQTGARS